MTDKEEIIIDGIDVSGCEHHRKCILPDNIGCKIDDFLCCDKPNCDYKQLARKTQECESLKEDCAELEQECEELKEENKVLQKLVSELEYSVQTGIELNARCCNALEEIENYFKSQDTTKTSLFNIFCIESEIKDIINKAKDGE